MRRTEGLLASVILALALAAEAAEPVLPDVAATPAERTFIERHWRGSIPPQGAPPARFSPIERSLQPEACGACHPVQLGDWQTSLHARSMGPGVMGQLVEMRRREPATARSCARCHAPVAEQRPELLEANRVVTNPDFDVTLESRGIICASCHLRGREHFGPPRRDGSTDSRVSRERLPHGGVTRTGAFLRAEFCASCHQFGSEGLAFNGKPLENTFSEWRRSPAARRGWQCQHCHMPDRRHLWRGIHDPEMVRGGLDIVLRAGRERYRAGEAARATLVITTPRVGHAFPTYVTPQVRVKAELRDAAGQVVAGSVEERVIGRQVPLDLSREIADTRIPPGGRFTLAYSRRVDGPGWRLYVTITVLPDEFYTRFFEVLLTSVAGAGEADIRRALEATRRSPYTLYEKELPLS
ncbi:MAG TPA: multiheme c-type cytochrome [Candidatus Bathyarchaeia archaeon]|nr:multiheme c-type cytochrome [Candidatus Bathyarchaeia archaeon]